MSNSGLRLSGEQRSDMLQQLTSIRDWLDEAEKRLNDNEEVEDILNDFHEAQGNLDDIVEKLEDITDGN